MIPHNQLRCQKKVLHIIFKNTNFLEIESKGLNIGALLKNPLDFHSPQGCKSLGDHPKKLKFKYILDSGRLVMFGLQNFSVQQFHGHLKKQKNFSEVRHMGCIRSNILFVCLLFKIY